MATRGDLENPAKTSEAGDETMNHAVAPAALPTVGMRITFLVQVAHASLRIHFVRLEEEARSVVMCQPCFDHRRYTGTSMQRSKFRSHRSSRRGRYPSHARRWHRGVGFWRCDCRQQRWSSEGPPEVVGCIRTGGKESAIVVCTSKRFED